MRTAKNKAEKGVRQRSANKNIRIATIASSSSHVLTTFTLNAHLRKLIHSHACFKMNVL